MGDGSRRVARLAAKRLRLENYQAYYNNPRASSPLPLRQSNEIIHLHGYFMLRGYDMRKGKILETLSEIDSLMSPHRSTLNVTLSSGNPCLTLDEVNTDLSALNWQEDFPVESLQSIAFTNSSDANDMQTGGVTERKRMKRVRRVKEKKAFDAVHVTKPRSTKKCAKRKFISDILDCGRKSAGLD